MEKLTQQQRNDLVLEYTLDNSKNNIKRLLSKYNISERRLFQIVKEDKTKAMECITDNRSNFSKRASEIIQKALNRLEQEIVNGDKITISQLSTTIGILYDKMRLEENLSTENKSINININIEK